MLAGFQTDFQTLLCRRRNRTQINIVELNNNWSQYKIIQL